MRETSEVECEPLPGAEVGVERALAVERAPHAGDSRHVPVPGAYTLPLLSST